MEIFTVGGAIRDELLGLPVQDRDYVVVGASPEDMLARGFKPVGRDFPVFLHPQSHAEYALARTERKTGRGYKGFAFRAAPEVSLSEDLARRDLTINAIARSADGMLIDPHRGVDDLAARVLRHVGPAFVEDPVRVLRLARFAARFTAFTVAPETMALAQEMVASGELDHLVPERVWQELAKGLLEEKPSRMFDVLRECGALRRLLPELDRLYGVPQRAEMHPEIDTGVHVMMVVDRSAQRGCTLPVRFAVLLHDLGKGDTAAADLPRHPGHEVRSVELANAVCKRLRVPVECRDLALLVARHHGDIHRAGQLAAAEIVTLLENTDALRRPERFEQLLEACTCDFQGRLGWQDAAYPAALLLRQALLLARGIDAAAIARSCPEPAEIGARIHAARVAALAPLVKPAAESAQVQRT
ncbi:multifunctional CCA addition/repair protein [Candidatus Accumulibacter sp. ACC007]|uniref:multifunctional CCA addition/repair protein n=1 Tax=Candidatus Accumulibacter sp. ACC007 TaxID=2823333 RepID=UPI0025BF2A7F|nr:multifunctional CCA addition/repair protein [Candidatus Accumulibacter sp. ACC007]